MNNMTIYRGVNNGSEKRKEKTLWLQIKILVLMGYLIQCDAIPQLHGSSLWDKIWTEVKHLKHGANVGRQKDREHNEHNDINTGVLWDKISDCTAVCMATVGVARVTPCNLPAGCRLLEGQAAGGSKFDIEDAQSVFFRNGCVSWKHTLYQSPENTTILGWRNSP